MYCNIHYMLLYSRVVAMFATSATCSYARYLRPYSLHDHIPQLHYQTTWNRGPGYPGPLWLSAAIRGLSARYAWRGHIFSTMFVQRSRHGICLLRRGFARPRWCTQSCSPSAIHCPQQLSSLGESVYLKTPRGPARVFTMYRYMSYIYYSVWPCPLYSLYSLYAATFTVHRYIYYVL